MSKAIADRLQGHADKLREAAKMIQDERASLMERIAKAESRAAWLEEELRRHRALVDELADALEALRSQEHERDFEHYRFREGMMDIPDVAAAVARVKARFAAADAALAKVPEEEAPHA